MRLEGKKLGGYGAELEHDVFTLGQKRKNNTGRRTLNKCYVQYLRERKGEVIMDVFPHPKGGSERLQQIGPMLDNHVAEGSMFIADSSRATKAWHLDNPHLNLWHLVICHARSNETGFTWYAVLDETDDLDPQYFTENEDCRVIEVILVISY